MNTNIKFTIALSAQTFGFNRNGTSNHFKIVRRINTERYTAKRAARVRTEPPVHALRMVTMTAWRQNLHLLPIFKHAQANGTLPCIACGRGRILFRSRCLIQSDRKGVNRRGAEPLLLRRRPRLPADGKGGGKGGELVESADPTGVKENKSYEKDDGE